jgi:hypothetical protein
MRFYVATQQHLCSVASDKRRDSNAAELGEWLYGQLGAGAATPHKWVSQFGPPKFRDLPTRRQALDILAAYDWIRIAPLGTMVDGPKRDLAFRINLRIAEIL